MTSTEKRDLATGLRIVGLAALTAAALAVGYETYGAKGLPGAVFNTTVRVADVVLPFSAL